MLWSERLIRMHPYREEPEIKSPCPKCSRIESARKRLAKTSIFFLFLSLAIPFFLGGVGFLLGTIGGCARAELYFVIPFGVLFSIGFLVVSFCTVAELVDNSGKYFPRLE
jgi:hypothetical protein